MSKKDSARKSTNKNTRKVSKKVKQDECPDGVCPIKKKKKSSHNPPKRSSSLWGKFLDFVFPSRLLS